MLNVFSAIEDHVLGTPLPSLQRCTALLHFERLTDLMCFVDTVDLICFEVLTYIDTCIHTYIHT